MGLNGSAVYKATLDAHQGQIFLGWPPWCSGLKFYSLQARCVTRIQPYGLGWNPTEPKMT